MAIYHYNKPLQLQRKGINGNIDPFSSKTPLKKGLNIYANKKKFLN